MFRFAMIAAALLLSIGDALAHEDAPAPPPKKEAPPVPIKVVQTKKGTLLTDSNGMTLYYFDRDDTGNGSNCNDECTKRWMPLAASNEDKALGDFTVIVRNDGSKMWAYRHRPLYTSHADKAPGDTYDADATHLWHIARPVY
jgi:predicted lipoprotein with Yx(FWY)xxD motif